MIKSLGNLTDKEICELRIKLLEPLIHSSSKHGIEKCEILAIAEKYWEFATKPIAEAGQTEQPKTKKTSAQAPEK